MNVTLEWIAKKTGRHEEARNLPAGKILATDSCGRATLLRAARSSFYSRDFLRALDLLSTWF